MHSTAADHLEWYFNNNLWKLMHYRGVRTLKYPMDMWSYQEIIHEYDIQWIIETGTCHGGSGLFFADLLEARKAKGNVTTIDIAPNLPENFPGHDRLISLTADSASPDLAKELIDKIPNEERLLLILDSNHSAQHVEREMETWVPLLRKTDYLIVEDTIVNGNPVRPDFGPGPLEAVKSYVERYPDMLTEDANRSIRFGASFADQGYFVKL